jgi:hypothetical protein
LVWVMVMLRALPMGPYALTMAIMAVRFKAASARLPCHAAVSLQSY